MSEVFYFVIQDCFWSPSSYDPVTKEKENRDKYHKYHAYKDQLEALLLGPTIAIKNYFTRFSDDHMLKGYARFNQAFDDVSDEQASSAIQNMINEHNIFTVKTLYYHLMDEYTWFQDTFGAAYQQAQEIFSFTENSKASTRYSLQILDTSETTKIID
jgi:hypothetical protein